MTNIVIDPVDTLITIIDGLSYEDRVLMAGLFLTYGFNSDEVIRTLRASLHRKVLHQSGTSPTSDNPREHITLALSRLRPLPVLSERRRAVFVDKRTPEPITTATFYDRTSTVIDELCEYWSKEYERESLKEFMEKIRSAFKLCLTGDTATTAPIKANIDEIWSAVDRNVEAGKVNDAAQLFERIALTYRTIDAVIFKLEKCKRRKDAIDSTQMEILDNFIKELEKFKLVRLNPVAAVGADAYVSWNWAYHHKVTDVREIIRFHAKVFNRQDQRFTLKGLRGKDENYVRWNVKDSEYLVSATNPPLIMTKTDVPNLFQIADQPNGDSADLKQKYVYARKTDFLFGFKTWDNARDFICN